MSQRLSRRILFVFLFSLLILGGAKISWAADIQQNLSLPENTYQIAKATFLPDYSESPFTGYALDGDYNLKGDCSSASGLYTKQNCTYPKAVVPASQCPLLPGYYTDCQCLSKFKITACNDPYILGGDSCEGKYEKCVCPAAVSLVYANDRCTKYCESRCIAKTCDPWANQTNCTNGTKACDNGCGSNSRQCCIPCTNKITSKPSNSSYTYSSCTDGNGSHSIQTGWKCNSGYHEKNGDCERDCIANSCSGYGLSSCPNSSTTNCSSCTKETTTCDGGGTMWKVDSCKDGYHRNGDSCIAHSYSCPSGYQEAACSGSQVQTATASKSCSCGATSGTCYQCRAKSCSEQGMKDCNGSCIATSACCGGCPSGKTCSNGTCVCIEETCSGYGLSSCPSNGQCSSCTTITSSCATGTKYKLTSCNSGYHISGNSCVKDAPQVTEGTITVIHKFPDGFNELGGGPWWNVHYKEPGQSLYNIPFPRGETGTYLWKTTTESKVKLGGELQFGKPDVIVPSGIYTYCNSSPSPSKTDASYLYYNIPTGNASVTITVTYCKK